MKRKIFLLFKKFNSSLLGKTLQKIIGMRYYNFMLSLIYTSMYYAFKPKDLILVEIHELKYYLNLQDKGIVPSLLKYGYYEKYTTEIFKKLIKKGMTVVILGANFGYYALIAAKLVGNRGKVYAFEPEPNNYNVLIKNINVNNYINIIPIQKAVSNTHGITRLFIDGINLGNPSFSEDNVPEKGGFVEVKTITLDKFFENVVKNYRVDFILSDTQGAEGLIIEGARKILENKNLKIIMEFWPFGLKNLGTEPLKLLHKLQNYGFKIKLIDEKNQYMKYMKLIDIINICERGKNVKGHVNLLLEK